MRSTAVLGATSGDRPESVEAVLVPLKIGYAHLETASKRLPGFPLVALDHGCCAQVWTPRPQASLTHGAGELATVPEVVTSVDDVLDTRPREAVPPELRLVSTGHEVACHFAGEYGQAPQRPVTTQILGVDDQGNPSGTATMTAAELADQPGQVQVRGAEGASVAWQAHIGGFVAGLMLFSLFDPLRRSATSAADASSRDI